MKPVFGRVENPTRAFLLIHEKRVPSPRFLWHFHDVYELNLVVAGAGTRFVGDHIGHFEAGDVVLMGPNLPHTWCGDAGSTARRRDRLYQAVAVQFADGFLGESLPSDPEWHHVRAVLARAGRGISFGGATREAVRERMSDLAMRSGPAKLMAFLDILELLASAGEYQLLSSHDHVPVLPGAREKRIDGVCTYINAHYTEQVTHGDAAAIARMGTAGFSRFFKRTMGKTFTDYVTELRLAHACRLLIETDTAIAAIAYQSGFNNLSNFNRRFLQHKQINPRVYRRRYQVNADPPRAEPRARIRLRA
jgi:AraC-like DNA-binding protein